MSNRQVGKSARAILGESIKALDELVRRGCDEKKLGALIVLMYNSHREITPRGLILSPQDMHQPMLGGLPLAKARKALENARKGLDRFDRELDKFRDAKVWRRVRDQYSDLKAATEWLRSTLGELQDAIGEIGPKAHPDFNARVQRLVRYVYEKTGYYNDALVAEIVGAAVPARMPRFPTAESMRMWRKDHMSRKPH